MTDAPGHNLPVRNGVLVINVEVYAALFLRNTALDQRRVGFLDQAFRKLALQLDVGALRLGHQLQPLRVLVQPVNLVAIKANSDPLPWPFSRLTRNFKRQMMISDLICHWSSGQ